MQCTILGIFSLPIAFASCKCHAQDRLWASTKSIGGGGEGPLLALAPEIMCTLESCGGGSLPTTFGHPFIFGLPLHMCVLILVCSVGSTFEVHQANFYF